MYKIYIEYVLTNYCIFVHFKTKLVSWWFMVEYFTLQSKKFGA